jgi:TetR/AcrR family transcriptional repressor of nem operon
MWYHKNMRKNKTEAAETRQRIIQIASELFRVKGIAATGIAEIMETAGLTNGGFYKHFESKDQLVQEALKASMGVLNQHFNDQGKEDIDCETIIKTYLSPEHQKGLEWGCPIGGIGSELGRIDKESRVVATLGIKQFISTLEKHIGSSSLENKKIAIASVSMMVGALTLSRIVDDKKLAEEILKYVEQVALELTSKNVN